MAEGGYRSTPDASRFMGRGEMQFKGGFLSKALFGTHKVDAMYKSMDKEKADKEKAEQDAQAKEQRTANYDDYRKQKRSHDVEDIHAKQAARNAYKTSPTVPTPTVEPKPPIQSEAVPANQATPVAPANPTAPANPAAKPARTPRAPKPTVAEPVNPEAGNDAKPGASAPAPTPAGTPKTTGMKSVFDSFGM